MFNLKKIARLEAELRMMTADWERERNLNAWCLDFMEKQADVLKELKDKVEPPTIKVVAQGAVDLARKFIDTYPKETSSHGSGGKVYYRIPANELEQVIISGEVKAEE